MKNSPFAIRVYGYVVTYLTRFFFSLRYKVVIRGLEEVLKRGTESKGILFLPNHTAHIDPMLFFSQFWLKFLTRPLVVEFISHLPVIASQIPLVKGVLIPDFETSINQYKIRKAERALEKVVSGLKDGDNFVIFPSGKFKNTGEESLKGSAAVHSILQKLPDTPIVMVRFSGLWGSSFSKALTGKSPNIVSSLKNGAKILLKNLFFFTPRRKVYIDLEFAPKDFPRTVSKVAINTYLENWYNQYRDDRGKIHEIEPLKLVPYYFWSEMRPKAAPQEKPKILPQNCKTSKEIEDRIKKQIRKILDEPNLEITRDMYLGDDLGMDSLNIAEMIAYLFKNYSLDDVSFDKLQKVEDLIEVAIKGEQPKQRKMEGPKFCWPKEKGRLPIEELKGKTFQEAFFHVCQRMNGFVAMGDDVSGIISYKNCKKAVLVLAESFKKFPERNIAILLPSSVGSTIIILAVLFAGKLPVLLNWTLGPRYLEQMMHLSKSERVISSWKFMEKINFVDFGSLVDRMEFIEDIRKKLTLKMKLKGVFYSLLPPKTALKKLKMDAVDENDPVALLFTSGTEASPKGVPLSHKNVIETVRNSYRHFASTFTPDSVIYDVLPQFHSFGFTAGTFNPLFNGAKVAFFPNPADSLGLAEGIQRWQVTVLPIVPNFLKKVLQVATKEELKSVRNFVTAGEKTPPEIYEKVKELGGPDAEVNEGYGLSETSPVVAITKVGHPPKGVGHIFPNIEAITIHPETHELLPEGAEGEICFYGPSVFSGYLGSASSPFVEIENKRWFRTGDLGRIDSDRSLILTGRLKRFIKIAGEMISLGGIESTLISALKERGLIQKDIPSLALIANEANPDMPKLLLFSIFPLEKELVNEILTTAGFSHIVKIAAVHLVDEIPLMATGKTNYRALLSVGIA